MKNYGVTPIANVLSAALDHQETTRDLTKVIVSTLRSPEFREALEWDEQGRQWIEDARDFNTARSEELAQRTTTGNSAGSA